MSTRWAVFCFSVVCFSLLESRTRSGAAGLAEVEPACSVVTPDPRVDMFQTGADGTTRHRTRRLRQIKAQKCRRGETLVYPARQAGQLALDCGQCAVFDLDIRARSSDRCWGLVPELVRSRQDCLFKNKCRLDYLKSMIVWTPRGVASCLGAWPRKLHVTTTCLNTEKHPVTDVVKWLQQTRGVEGLVRSHFYYRLSPSKYPKGGGLGSLNYTLELSPPEPPSGHTFLLLHTHSMDLAQDDSLRVLGLSLDCNSTWREGATYVIRSGNLHKISLFFSLGASRQSGNGFEICFRWFTGSNESSAAAMFERTLEKCTQYRHGFQDPELPVYDVIQNDVTQHVTGVVRSHPSYPWNYPRPRAAPTSSSQATQGSSLGQGRARYRQWRTVTHKLTAPPGLTQLRITARRVSLAGHDSLVIHAGNGSVYRVVEGKSYNIQGECPILNFRIEASHLHTSHGFLLCYKWFSRDSVDQIEEDLCGSKTFALKVGCQKTRRRKLKKLKKMKKLKKQKKQKGRMRKRRQSRPGITQTLPEECRP